MRSTLVAPVLPEPQSRRSSRFQPAAARSRWGGPQQVADGQEQQGGEDHRNETGCGIAQKWKHSVGRAQMVEEKDNQQENTSHHRAVRSRLGMLSGEFVIPDDFDQMEQETIADLFEGISKD